MSTNELAGNLSYIFGEGGRKEQNLARLVLALLENNVANLLNVLSKSVRWLLHHLVSFIKNKNAALRRIDHGLALLASHGIFEVVLDHSRCSHNDLLIKVFTFTKCPRRRRAPFREGSIFGPSRHNSACFNALVGSQCVDLLCNLRAQLLSYSQDNGLRRAGLLICRDPCKHRDDKGTGLTRAGLSLPDKVSWRVADHKRKSNLLDLRHSAPALDVRDRLLEVVINRKG
mmetsp:Transcript_9279/g.18282  ORF Transcript_9279/g.18282 Transcript_9279/m.18282 type:complete len:229 (+) Transcript_9279:1026-1712(+)